MTISYSRVIPLLVFAALRSTCRYVFRTGYFPSEWSWKLALAMGLIKASAACIPYITVEDVSANPVIANRNKMQRLSSRPAAKFKDAWLLDVPVTRTAENAERVIRIVNAALAALGGDTTGLTISENDVVDISAEWTAIKSESSFTGETPA